MPSRHIRNSLSVSCSLFALLCLSAAPASGQTVEEVVAAFQVEEDGNILSENELLILEDLVRRPLDINSVGGDLLEGIPLVTSTDAVLVIKKREEIGIFTSPEQLLDIQGLSLFARQLLPLVTTVRSVPPVSVTLRNRWVTTREDIRLLTRQTVDGGRWSGGFLLERDPGERLLADFASGHISVPVGSEIRFVLGDHQLQTGYGLLFGRTIPSIKGYGSLTGMGRVGKGLKPYRSSIEYWALRGIALEKRDPSGRWTVSLTSSPKDATIDSNRILSISTSGFHTTPSAVEKKHNVREEMAVLAWQRDGNGIGEYGVVVARDRWTANGTPVSNRPGNSYVSFFWQIESQPLQFFGEMAAQSGSASSFLTGLILKEKNFRWLSSVRRYRSGFQGPRSQPFREWTGSTLNETAIYQSVTVKLGRHRIRSYGDVYEQSLPTSETGRRLRGFEVSGTWRYRWRRGALSLRWKREDKFYDQEISFREGKIAEITDRESWRFNSSLSFPNDFRIQLHFDRRSVADENSASTGYGAAVKAHVTREPWRWSLNWVLFRSDDYQSRVYVWDLNLPGELRNRAFFLTGQSVACLLRVKTSAATLTSRIRWTWDYSPRRSFWSKPRLEMGYQMDIAF